MKCRSDINFNSMDQTYLIAENFTTQITLDLPWSFSGSTTISYTIGNYLSQTAPAWVTINSSTGVLSVSTPFVASDTEYDFYVISSNT